MSLELYSSEYVKYKTLRGKDGWLYIWDIDGINEVVTGKTQYDPRYLAMGCRVIDLRQQWCASRGIQYVHTAAPDKSSVYPEFLPDAVIHNPNGVLKAFSEALSGYHVCFIDTMPTLMRLKDRGPVYFKTDSHWTYSAAYEILKSLMAPITNAFPLSRILEEDELAKRTVNRVMELAALMPTPDKEEYEIIEPKFPVSKLAFQSESTRGKIQVFETGRKNLPRCVLFRDSFSSFYLNVMRESFSRIVVLNSRIFWYDLIEKERPDVVVVEVAERYLEPITTDLYPSDFETTFKVKINDIVNSGEVRCKA